MMTKKLPALIMLNALMAFPSIPMDMFKLPELRREISSETRTRKEILLENKANLLASTAGTIGSFWKKLLSTNKTEEPVQVAPTRASVEEDKESVVPIQSIQQITQVIRPFDLSLLKQELLSEMHNYALNFKSQELQPSITRQSDADAGRRGTIISSITESYTFTTPTLSGLTTIGNILATGSSTLQSFTFTTATGTSATTTSFFSTTASSTNLFFTTATGGNFTSSGLGTFSNLLATGSSTLQNFTFANATGTSATTTNFFSTTASSTNLFFTTGTGGNLTISGTGTFNNILANASSTFQNFTFANATGTSATTTSFFATTASSTNLFSSLFTAGSNALVVNASGYVGLGLSAPTGLLHVRTTAGTSISATGGTITNSGGYTIHTFTSSGTFTPNGAGNVEVLVVGGGGGGGGGIGGGGGGGEVEYNAAVAVTAQAYTVTVGAGGVGGTPFSSSAGNNSSFNGITGEGGGAGGGQDQVGGNGPTGGGGSRVKSGGTGTLFNGGNGSTETSGGGAGSGGAGQNAGANAGNGGAGVSSSISGSAVTYGGGGGGGTINTKSAGTGTDGGGNGTNNASTAASGTANRGGGGGGGGYDAGNGTGGAGGSGVVIIRYLTPNVATDSIFVSPTNSNVGIAMTSPSVALDVTGDIEYTGTITDVSDERLKENIAPITNALDIIRGLDGKSFNMIGDSTIEYGFIAQQVEEIFPGAAHVVDPVNGYLGVNYFAFTPVLAEAVKEIDISITSLALRIDSLASTTVALTPESESFVSSFFDNLFSKVTTWLADAGNGIGDFFANKIHTKEICVAKADGTEFCMNGDQLEAIAGAHASQNVQAPISNGQEDTATSTEEVIEETITEEEPASEPEPEAPAEKLTPESVEGE